MSARSNPITPQAAVVVNGWFDRHFASWRQKSQATRWCAKNPFEDVSLENFTVLPRELAFKLLPEHDMWIQRPAATAGGDNGPRVFTSANGFPFFEDPDGKDVKSLRDSVVFVGLPLIPIDAGNPNQKDSVSIMVSGSTSIYNTGPQRIAAGDLVVWDLPKRTDRAQRGVNTPAGVPRNKALFVTLPLDARDDDSAACARATLREILDEAAGVAYRGEEDQRVAKRARRDLDPDMALVSQTYKIMAQSLNEDNVPNARRAVHNFVESVLLQMNAKLNRRIIGRALSSAEPGESFDILLRGGGAF